MEQASSGPRLDVSGDKIGHAGQPLQATAVATPPGPAGGPLRQEHERRTPLLGRPDSGQERRGDPLGILHTALRSEAPQATGDHAACRALPDWLHVSRFAAVERAAVPLSR